MLPVKKGTIQYEKYKLNELNKLRGLHPESRRGRERAEIPGYRKI
jgi:hypothetical protein